MMTSSGGATNGMGGGSGNATCGGGGAMAFDMIGKTNVTIKIHVTNNDFFISYPPFVIDSLIKKLSGEPVFAKNHPLFADAFQ